MALTPLRNLSAEAGFRHGVGLILCGQSRHDRWICASQKIGDVRHVGAAAGRLPVRRDRPLRRLDRTQIDGGRSGKLVAADDIDRRSVALNQRTTSGRALRPRPRFEVAGMGTIKPGAELGIERDTEIDLGQVRAGDLAKCM
jgi:hypothetical protein